jgi:hypothetical protein
MVMSDNTTINSMSVNPRGSVDPLVNFSYQSLYFVPSSALPSNVV